MAGAVELKGVVGAKGERLTAIHHILELVPPGRERHENPNRMVEVMPEGAIWIAPAEERAPSCPLQASL